MKALLFTAGLLAGLASYAVSAQAAPPAASQPVASRTPEPAARRLVTQDRAVRIEEQQVRGATTSIHVQPLHGGAAYDIVPPQPGQRQPGDMQGRMQWHVLNFR